MELKKIIKPMAVEQLVMTVKPDLVDRWLELDHEIWSKGLAKWPGYIRKEVWESRERPGRLTINIYWEDYDAWQAIDSEWVKETDTYFNDQFAPETVQFNEALHTIDQNFLIAESGGL